MVTAPGHSTSYLHSWDWVTKPRSNLDSAFLARRHTAGNGSKTNQDPTLIHACDRVVICDTKTRLTPCSFTWPLAVGSRRSASIWANMFCFFQGLWPIWLEKLSVFIEREKREREWIHGFWFGSAPIKSTPTESELQPKLEETQRPHSRSVSSSHLTHDPAR